MTPPGPIDRMFGAIVPRAVDAIDIDEVIDQVDVDHLISQVDVDGIVARVDVDAVVQRVDIGAILDRVDIEALMHRIDLDVLLTRVDLNALLADVDLEVLLTKIDLNALLADVDLEVLLTKIDLNALLTKVDLNTLLTKIDLNALLAGVDLNALLADVDLEVLLTKVDLNTLLTKIDLNALLADVDLDALLARIDVDALMKRAHIDDIVSNASRGVFARLIDAVRRQLVGLDLLLVAVVTRLLRRPREQVSVTGGTVTGRVAGGISRLAAFLIDIGVISVSYGFIVSLLVFMIGLFSGQTFDPSHRALLWLGGIGVFGFFYYWIGLAVTGRSIGKGLIGLRVVNVDGRPISPGRAAVRTIVYPFSFILGLGLIPIVVGKQRRALHDFAAGDKELYDWGDRPAEMPAPLSAWVQQRAADVDPTGVLTATPAITTPSSNASEPTGSAPADEHTTESDAGAA
jgi:uncharacterized RDD family membrane protein YckC